MNDKRFSKYDRKLITKSIYCYEESDVLINKAGIKDAKAFEEYEADVTMIRQYQLENEKVNIGRFSVTHLRNIHKFIFQDVFPFAGKLRVEDIWKGDTFFCKSEFIEENLKVLLDKLKNDKYLYGLNFDDFLVRAAFYMAELNIIHPFREGNGRTIREFIRQLALKCDFEIDWSLINGDKLLEAMILSVDKNYKPLSICLEEAIIKISE